MCIPRNMNRRMGSRIAAVKDSHIRITVSTVSRFTAAPASLFDAFALSLFSFLVVGVDGLICVIEFFPPFIVL